MKNKIVYSVIIPHHDTPDLLQRCLESIPRREDLEIIIVDDNSNLSKEDFDTFPGLGEENVEVIFSKEGRGAGYARNLGVEKSSGEWLIFADADDFFTSNMAFVLDKYKDNHTLDLVFFNANTVDEYGVYNPTPLGKYISNYISRRPYAEKILRYGFWTPWSRMYRSRLIKDNNILFEELPTGNDVMFVLNATKLSKSFDIIKDPVYIYYVPTGGSQTSKKYTKEFQNIRLETRLRMLRIYKEINYPFLPPIIGTFPVFSDHSLNPLLDSYKYNYLEDIKNYISHALAKLFNII